MTERHLDFNTLTSIGSQQGQDQTQSQTSPFTNSVSRTNICTYGTLSKNTSLQHSKTFSRPYVGWALIMPMQLHVFSTKTPQPVCLSQSHAFSCLSYYIYYEYHTKTPSTYMTNILGLHFSEEMFYCSEFSLLWCLLNTDLKWIVSGSIQVKLYQIIFLWSQTFLFGQIWVQFVTLLRFLLKL